MMNEPDHLMLVWSEDLKDWMLLFSEHKRMINKKTKELRAEVAELKATDRNAHRSEIKGFHEGMIAQDEMHRANAAKVPKGFSIDPFRSGGFINKDYDMGRVYIDLPIAEARQLLAMLNKEGA